MVSFKLVFILVAAGLVYYNGGYARGVAALDVVIVSSGTGGAQGGDVVEETLVTGAARSAAALDVVIVSSGIHT